MPAIKILQIGKYPPPFCGWAVQTKLPVEEIRKRGQAAVKTCREGDAADRSAKLCEIAERDAEPVKQVQLQEPGSNVAETADWLLGDAPECRLLSEESFVHV